MLTPILATKANGVPSTGRDWRLGGLCFVEKIGGGRRPAALGTLGNALGIYAELGTRLRPLRRASFRLESRLSVLNKLHECEDAACVLSRRAHVPHPCRTVPAWGRTASSKPSPLMRT